MFWNEHWYILSRDIVFIACTYCAQDYRKDLWNGCANSESAPKTTVTRKSEQLHSLGDPLSRDGALRVLESAYRRQTGRRRLQRLVSEETRQ